MLDARLREEQRAIFETELAPVFDSAFMKWLTSQPASLFGLGIPPAQYEALAGDERMDGVLKTRLEKLACDFDPNNPGRASGDARFNRATLGTYEMGSTFKIFTMAMELDAGVASMREKIGRASGRERVGRSG